MEKEKVAKDKIAKRIKIAGASVFVLLWIALTIWAWCISPAEISNTERRKLAQMPEMTKESVISGKFVKKFEEYTLDQFPMRDTFRSIKSVVNQMVLFRGDNDGLYLNNGSIIKIEYPLNEASVRNLTKVINKIYDKHIKNTDCKTYFAMVPDKAYFEDNMHPKMDYARMITMIQHDLNWAKYIDITKSLDQTFYYKTDPHWRHELLSAPAAILGEQMHFPAITFYDCDMQRITTPFYGAYYGQMALPMKSEDMFLMFNKQMEKATVHDMETNKDLPVFNLNAKPEKDLYDVYLHGPKALLTIDIPEAETDKELVIFRDSFGSSLVPYLFKGYKKITVVDLRYLKSDYLGKYVKFDDQDVLFLYSSLIINNSFSIQ